MEEATSMFVEIRITAKDVHSTLIEICPEHGKMSLEEAKEFVESTLMKTQKRYLRDVY